jgi:hypothetical protein
MSETVRILILRSNDTVGWLLRFVRSQNDLRVLILLAGVQCGCGN